LDIEEVLLQHPEVLEVAVLGVPDEGLGQIIKALVVLKQLSAQGQQQVQKQEQQGQQQQQRWQGDQGRGQQPQAQQEQNRVEAAGDARGPKVERGNSEGVEEELRSWCAERLAKYQVPRQWVMLQESLPRNAMGKVNKKQLQNQFCP
jgi:acyl-coenzyme A synthetase/AMP-(fatty) acid ligase